MRSATSDTRPPGICPCLWAPSPTCDRWHPAVRPRIPRLTALTRSHATDTLSLLIAPPFTAGRHERYQGRTAIDPIPCPGFHDHDGVRQRSRDDSHHDHEPTQQEPDPTNTQARRPAVDRTTWQDQTGPLGEDSSKIVSRFGTDFATESTHDQARRSPRDQPTPIGSSAAGTSPPARVFLLEKFSGDCPAAAIGGHCPLAHIGLQ